ncbi:type II toxin-antitoxin system TacA family antitoxin [Methylomagnum sp.]
MATPSAERGRITARVPIHTQQTLETAAALTGATVNQFVVQAALREAERIIEQERVIRLSGDDARQFLDALDNPPPPNETLLATLTDYTERRDDKTGSLDWAPRPKRV